MNIDDTTKDILLNLKVDDTAKTVTIMSQLDRKQYQSVNELLETAGGKWNRKAKAHVFNVSPSEALKIFWSGDSVTKTVTTNVETSKEIKKEHQAFFTPDKLADELASVAELAFPYNPPEAILEPSAGNGSLVKALLRKWSTAKIDACEIQERYHQGLKGLGAKVVGSDFLQFNGRNYDLILANVPFAKHADIAHIRHAYDLLADGGGLISVTSNHWRHASHRIDKEFKAWLESLDAEIYDIDSGRFKESGTMVSSNYIVLRK
jgi:hypothetical protein